jgi:hypothetical protein
MGFTLKIYDLRPLTIGVAIERILASSKKRLDELRLFDMLLDENIDAESALRHGVYLFLMKAIHAFTLECAHQAISLIALVAISGCRRSMN